MNQIKELFMNPVLVKEIRQRWRTFKTPLLLSLYLLGLGGFAVFVIYEKAYSFGYIEPGFTKEFYTMLSLGQLGLIALITPGIAATSISGERERQTLNVLLTTQLSPASIIVSKLLTSVAYIVLLMVASLPIYALILLYGGVSPWQLLGTFGFFIITAIFCGAFGVLCSVWFKRTSVSTVVAYIGLLVFLAGAPLLFEFIRNIAWNGWRYPNHPFLNNNPFLNTAPVILQGLSPVIMLVSMFQNVGFPVAPENLNLNIWFTNPWPVFLIGIPFLILLFITSSIYLLHPVRSKPKWLAKLKKKTSVSG